ncbi:cytochrome c biogenesis protein CcdA [Streptobacillus moniliformis]|uniref:Cytochrome c biogenesis protein transmembrane region n=1 Tax=Streptobacillus moniliformis (strain ATCC 14647 / DSM 12112 / NCTC 10651 / 9901) TaxID=519441 RepID=D1AVU9_STRM9|nr:cytochrome c biogenesis CcdA family protein [Streptobacillus moniliformis]ACZ01859.1 cytochrome c biogenesis protein transmembrane region [Streptobacillus moniliformis DSM 12112]AVL43147.1 cytochrome c biogenesis protein CcdA [Streptobacillus moniliformis]SQA12935.1 thiol:disulfide interchange protein precursor [Streptobacillus moniliformis]
MFDLSIITIFLSGVLMFFSPCIFPLIPIYFGVLEKDNKKIRNTALFLLGISLTFVILGFGFGLLSDILFNPLIRIIAGIIIIILGLQQLGIFDLAFLEKTKTLQINRKYNNSGLESFMLGATFSLGWTPCIGPILGAVLFLSGDRETAVQGAVLLLIFVLGFSTPFLIFTMFYNKLIKKVEFIKKNLNVIKKISAVLIILMGLLLIFDKLTIIVSYFNKLSM